MRKKLLFTVISTLLISCNPFPKEDKYPKVPNLSDLIKHKNILEKVELNFANANVEFLKSDKILVKTSGDFTTIKIFDINKSLIFETKFDYKLPFYIDKKGNIFVNNLKYFQPDYKRIEKYEIIDINKLITDFQIATEKTIPKNDSIYFAKSKIYADNFIKKNNLKIIDSTSAFGGSSYTHYPKIIQDSIIKHDQQLKTKYPSENKILIKKVDDYEKILAKKFDIENLDRSNPKTHIKEKDNQLVFWSEEKYVNNYEKEQEEFDEFDDKILVEWQNGRLPSPIYLNYYQLTKKQRFKVKDYGSAVTIEIENKDYLYSNEFGLYLIK